MASLKNDSNNTISTFMLYGLISTQATFTTSAVNQRDFFPLPKIRSRKSAMKSVDIIPENQINVNRWFIFYRAFMKSEWKNFIFKVQIFLLLNHPKDAAFYFGLKGVQCSWNKSNSSYLSALISYISRHSQTLCWIIFHLEIFMIYFPELFPQRKLVPKNLYFICETIVLWHDNKSDLKCGSLRLNLLRSPHPICPLNLKRNAFFTAKLHIISLSFRLKSKLIFVSRLLAIFFVTNLPLLFRSLYCSTNEMERNIKDFYMSRSRTFEIFFLFAFGGAKLNSSRKHSSAKEMENCVK